MARTITVPTFTQVAVPESALRPGFILKDRWLYENGKIIGEVREMIDESPSFSMKDFARASVLEARRGPFTFVLW